MLVLFSAMQAGNRSGTGRYACALAKELPGRADDVEVKVFWPHGVDGADGINEHALVESAAAGTFARFLFDQRGLPRIQKGLQADLIHYPSNIGPLVGSSPSVLTVHDLSFMREPRWFTSSRARYYRIGVARSAARARRVVADSQATADDLIRFLQIPAETIDVVHLGVDERFRPAPEHECVRVREAYELPQQYFLYSGTLEPRKNLVRLIDAWSSIADTCDRDLVIAGRDGWKTESVRKAAAASTHADRIHFPGFVSDEDLVPLISGATAFVWTSLWEGFGLPPLEAMACGTPVLTSNTSSLPEVVGEAALTVAPEDAEAIAEGMLRLSRDEKLREELRAAGIARAAKFRWERTADALLDTYRKAIRS